MLENDTKSHDNQSAKNIDKGKMLKLSEKIGHIILGCIRMTIRVDFTNHSSQRQWSKNLKALKRKCTHARILYPVTHLWKRNANQIFFQAYKSLDFITSHLC